MIGSVLGRGGEAGRNRRLEDAEKGVVEWQTPNEIKRFLAQQRKRELWTERARKENTAAEFETTRDAPRTAEGAEEAERREQLELREALREADEAEE